ncbi:uroporphyrinogen-III C-methyltransferase [Aquabacterium sp. A7-Y]|uniref:uroporphyrinogen-III C-methyltransferase n=1 Tax=Aquabacterium sp. A7-Y TaxID=1349605 RepID=UPI00223D1AD0|nr:uroporphyrinogen-III C-methyltransferase [Aquabacterium sp. A7-Y]MCW7541075.1 uroporphyrinogen-III C-methyltransferase [Aquabacterium sp. A7-Y]
MPPITKSPSPAPAPAAPSHGSGRGLIWTAGAGLLVICGASLVLAYQAHQRVQSLAQQLVQRQENSQDQANEARTLARDAQDIARDAGAKVALLDARLAEVALQRGQLDELMMSLSRSRDENLVVDIDSSLRLAVQQAVVTGSAEPMVAALRAADERLQRVNQPRLEGVRRAIARDLERVRSVGVADVSALVIRLDEAVRIIDELPLVSSQQGVTAPAPAPAASSPIPTSGARAAGKRMAASAPADPPPPAPEAPWWQRAAGTVWDEVRSLVRVTRIDRPEAMLIAPEQGFFLRENLKLRLLNARLALLSRQFETVQSDLQSAQQALDRYFDHGSRRWVLVDEQVRQVMAQARQSSVPRPDESFTALAAAAAGR